MADHSVNYLLTLINKQVEFWENQSEFLYKARALTEVALGDAFQEHTKLVFHHYLSALDDILENAQGASEASLSLLELCLNQSNVVLP
jgi:hypothetical protein